MADFNRQELTLILQVLDRVQIQGLVSAQQVLSLGAKVQKMIQDSGKEIPTDVTKP